MTLPINADYIFEVPSVSQPHLSDDGSTLAFVKTTIDRATMERKARIIVSRHPFDDRSALTDGPTDTPRLSITIASSSSVRTTTTKSRSGRSHSTRERRGALPTFRAAWKSSPFHRTATGSRPYHPSTPTRRMSKSPACPACASSAASRYRHELRGYTGDIFRQLFLVDIESGRTHQITDGEGDNWSPKWSPDGRSVAFISDDIAGRDFTSNSQVKVVTLPDGKPVSWSESLPYVWAVAWSPDGESLAAIGSHDPELWDPRSAWLYVLGLMEASAGSQTASTRPFRIVGCRGPPSAVSCSSVSIEGCTSYAPSVPTAATSKLITGGGEQIDGASIEGSASKAVILAESPRSPVELAYVDLDTGTTHAITSYAGSYLDSHTPARMEKFTIHRGSFEIESRVLLPPDFTDTKSYPVVLDIHGGRTAGSPTTSIPYTRFLRPTDISCCQSTRAAPRRTARSSPSRCAKTGAAKTISTSSHRWTNWPDGHTWTKTAWPFTGPATAAS